MRELVADLFGLPDWTPRRLQRAVALVLIAIAVMLPATFSDGLLRFSERQAQRMVKLMQPLLEDLTQPGGSSAVPPKPAMDRVP